MLKTLQNSIANGTEHVALLEKPDTFDFLLCMVDFFDDNVQAVFGVKDETAKLQAICFRADTFSPADAKIWLNERRIPVMVFEGASEVRYSFTEGFDDQPSSVPA